MKPLVAVGSDTDCLWLISLHQVLSILARLCMCQSGQDAALSGACGTGVAGKVCCGDSGWSGAALDGRLVALVAPMHVRMPMGGIWAGDTACLRRVSAACGHPLRLRRLLQPAPPVLLVSEHTASFQPCFEVCGRMQRSAMLPTMLPDTPINSASPCVKFFNLAWGVLYAEACSATFWCY